jgi:hypothetical protein
MARKKRGTGVHGLVSARAENGARSARIAKPSNENLSSNDGVGVPRSLVCNL